MQNNSVPNHNEKRSVFLWVPTPKTPPRLIGPDTAKDSADETEQSGEADDSVHHPAERSCSRLIEGFCEQAAKNVNNAQNPGEKCCGVTKRDHDDVSRKPDVSIQHSTQHLESIAIELQILGDQQSHKTHCRSAHATDSVPIETFEKQAEQNRSPPDKNRRAVQVGNRRATLQVHPCGKPGRVKEKCKQKKNNSGFAKCLWPLEPRNQSEKEDDQIQYHRLQKWLCLVKEELQLRPFHLAGDCPFQVLTIFPNNLIESVHIPASVG